MTLLGEIGRRLRVLVRGSRIDRELAEEMRQHIELRQERLRHEGLSAEEARDTARRRFGNVLRLREACIDAWSWRWLEELGQDIRFGARTLLRNPGFTVTAVLTLALATGATTAIFSIVNGVLLRPLPFAEPDRLVQVTEIHQVGGVGSVFGVDLEEFRRQSTSFEMFAGYELTTKHLQSAVGPERLTAVVAERDFFSLLGVQPAAGRTFRAGDPASVVVLSARLWNRRFNRDPSVIGKTITLYGQRWDGARRRTVVEPRRLTVLGVMPDAFQFPYRAASIIPGALAESRTDVWVPDDQRRGGGRFSYVTGRLKPGVTVDAAATELSLIKERLDARTPNPYSPTGVQLVPLTEDVVGSIRRSLWLLFGAVGLVLAAACANVANLLLARMTVRAREVVTRAALGAGRLRLVRQFLAESLLLSLTGGLLGAAVARWGIDVLVVLGSAKIPRAHEITLDWQAFAFLLLVCIATAALFGLAPALTAARADVQTVTRESGGHATMGSYGRIRDGLVVTEVALAFVLAAGVAVVMSELSRLQRTDTGMVTANVLTFHLTPKVPHAEYFRLEERVAQLPGVEAAGMIQLVPLQNWGWTGTFHVHGRPREELSRLPTAELRTVTPGYFQALGIPIRKGRGLVERDAASAAAVLLINEALARRHFPGEDLIGRETDRGTIVGVVGDVRQVGLDRPAVPEIYQTVTEDAGIASDIGMSLIVRTRGRPEAIVDSVRSAVRAVNPSLAIFNIRTMEQVLADSLWELNLYRWLIGLFAALALVLAAIGLYGVIAYSVTARAREFAVRLALGSDPSRLARLVLRRGAGLAALGVAIGAVGTLLLASWLPNLPTTFGASPATLVGTSALLLAIALLACVVPAIRVAGVNPATALRHD